MKFEFIQMQIRKVKFDLINKTVINNYDDNQDITICHSTSVADIIEH